MHELEIHLATTNVNQELYTEWEVLVNYSLEHYNFTSNSTGQIIDGAITNWWASAALVLVLCTAAGNVLVCLAIYLERRLQNVTNYFLMSLAITDLLVAILVMPLGIVTLVMGKFLAL